jgi:hypothetical protein
MPAWRLAAVRPGPGPSRAALAAVTPTPPRPRAAAKIVAAKRRNSFHGRNCSPSSSNPEQQTPAVLPGNFPVSLGSWETGVITTTALGVRATWVARTRIRQLMAGITVAIPVRPGPGGRGPSPVRPDGRGPSPVRPGGRCPSPGRGPNLRVPRANRGSCPNPSYCPSRGPRTLLGTIAGRGRAERAPRLRRPLRPGPKRRLWRISLQQNVE